MTTNFVYDDTDLWDDKVEVNPVTVRGQQWGASEAALTKGALLDLRSALLANINGVNGKQFGVVGDGVTDDSAAINAALAAVGTTTGGVFGGFVYLPKGKYLCGSQLVLPNGVGLRGDGPANTILQPSSSFSAASLIRNQNQDGTQEYAFLESLQINGAGKCSTAVVDLGSLFVNSYVRDVVITNGANIGLHVSAGGSPGGTGPILIENVWVANCTGHNVLFEELAGNAGAATSIVCVNLTSEHQGSGRSAIYLKGLGSAGQWSFYNTHIELSQVGATNQTGITFDGVAYPRFDGVVFLGAPGTVTAAVTITNVAQNVGIEIGPIWNPNGLTLINDLKNLVSVGGVNRYRYVTPEASVMGGMRFTPSGASAIGVAFQDSSSVDRSWFNGSGQLTGNSLNGGGVDIVGDTTNNRALVLAPNAGSGFTNKYWWLFPAGGGGVLRFSGSSGNDAFQVGTDGTIFFYQSPTFQSAVTMQSGLTVQRSVAFSNELAPAALGADQNDYSPANLANAYDLFLSASIANVNITSIATPANGRDLYVYNSGGANTITLKNASGSGTVANRIIGWGNADVVLNPGKGVLLRYSTSLSRWVVRHSP